MSLLAHSGTYKFGEKTIYRMGYGAMQLAGPGVFGPPKDIDMARSVLKAVIEAGVNHIDTSDFYGPHVTNQLICETLYPYPEDLVLVTKISAKRGADGSWLPAFSREELTSAIHDNLRNLKLDVIEVVNLRSMHGLLTPAEGSLEEPLAVMAELQAKGLIKHIGISNVTPKQLKQARSMVEIVCVQNAYNIAYREDDLMIDQLAKDGIPYVPYFPLGGFNTIQAEIIRTIAKRHHKTVQQILLAWLLKRSENILLIPGTSQLDHLHDNLAAASIILTAQDLAELDQVPKQTIGH
jgi:aryl-alcohol dehydrogenase-like predicted oxidoreductase